MVRALAFLLTIAAYGHGQTRVRPEQIRNVQQVRIYWGDGMPATTHLRAGWAGQMSDGRFIMSPADLARFPPPVPPDDYVLTPVCIVQWIGQIVAGGPETIIRLPMCYSVEGVANLHADPNWDTWLRAHGQ